MGGEIRYSDLAIVLDEIDKRNYKNARLMLDMCELCGTNDKFLNGLMNFGYGMLNYQMKDFDESVSRFRKAESEFKSCKETANPDIRYWYSESMIWILKSSIAADEPKHLINCQLDRINGEDLEPKYQKRASFISDKKLLNWIDCIIYC